MLNKKELIEKRERLFKKWDDLDNVIHILEATANTYYSPLDKDLIKGWNTLLISRDKLKPFINSEIDKVRVEIDKLKKEIKKLENEK